MSTDLLAFDNLRPALLLIFSPAEDVVFLLTFPWFEYIKIVMFVTGVKGFYD